MQSFPISAVMYANALYKTGHAREGYKVLRTLLDTAMDFDRSKMYPGIPEYFDNQGRGYMHTLPELPAGIC